MMNNCLLCDVPLQAAPSWRQLFTRFDATLCQRCEQQFDYVNKCCDVQPDLAVHALFSYNEKMIDYLHRYKFMHDTLLANVFRAQLYHALKHTAVIPIPMHPEKMKERTFPHVELLLQAAGVKYEQLLSKTTTDTQGTKTREQRMTAVQFFELIQQPHYKTYTIVDDIVTTGTTLKHARELLLQAGAKEVRCLTLIKA